MNVRTEIEIDASADRVWEALIDFASYPQWNPFITSVEGRATVNERLRMKLSTSDGTEISLSALLERVEPGSELRWTTKLWVRRLLDSEHFFQLVPLSDCRTRLLNGEDFGGVLVQYMGRRLTHMARGFVGMNQALKKHVEAAARR